MRKTPEADLQESVVAELRLRTIAPARFWFCPNGGNLSKAQSARFQRMGLTSGVSDLHFAWFTDAEVAGEVPTILRTARFGVIELKAGKGRTSDTQDDFLRDMHTLGHHAAVCKSASEVMGTLRRWGFPLR